MPKLSSLALPLSSESRVSCVMLLRPDQQAWLRNHAGRRGVSLFMRRLLDQLMEQERQEIRQAQQRIAARKATAAAES